MVKNRQETNERITLSIEIILLTWKYSAERRLGDKISDAVGTAGCENTAIPTALRCASEVSPLTPGPLKFIKTYPL